MKLVYKTEIDSEIESKHDIREDGGGRGKLEEFYTNIYALFYTS